LAVQLRKQIVLGLVSGFLAIFVAGAALAADNDLSNLFGGYAQEFTDLSVLAKLGPSSGPARLGSPAPGSIGIDYTPEARCSQATWPDTPAACNPQLSFTCPPDVLSTCPRLCQACYDDDLKNLQTSLNVSAITSYQPNYYILRTAQARGMKVLQGLFDDAIPSLAASDSSTNCTFSGAPIALCGTKYAGAMLDGACGTTTPWNPATFCQGGPYIEPLNFPTGTDAQKFIENGTITGIQIGNEALGKTIDGQLVTAQMLSQAAQTLRKALDARHFTQTPIIISLVLGQEKDFCENGAPPAGVNLIASHPYCNFVSSVPPSWEKDGPGCWAQVETLYKDNSVKYCGASNVFIGETGYNTGCPGVSSSPPVKNEEDFIASLKDATCVTQSPSGFPTFLFAYSDVCPADGCKAGCSSSSFTGGNGYFGIFYTKDYGTSGPTVAKFTPPSLQCTNPFPF
jgi:hypothetical protein